MNTSFDPFALVNTYGAFGSITKDRHEIILQVGAAWCSASRLLPYSANWRLCAHPCPTSRHDQGTSALDPGPDDWLGTQCEPFLCVVLRRDLEVLLLLLLQTTSFRASLAT